MAVRNQITTAEAVRILRADAKYAHVIRDAYLDHDLRKAAERFRQSGEFAEVSALLGSYLPGGRILDLGAGIGIASYAFSRAGAAVVYALEPDPSDVVGRGAIRQLSESQNITILDGHGENIPLPDESVDVVYGRQVLHHAKDVRQVLREVARVLRSGGLLLLCREHVADNEAQLRQFLAEHPIHQLAGGENAYPLEVYSEAIGLAGLAMLRVMGPWDSLINAFPIVRSRQELERFPDVVLRERFPKSAALFRFLPGMRSLTWKRIKSWKHPGRLFSFLAAKPEPI